MVFETALSANHVLTGAGASHRTAQVVLTNPLISAEAAMRAGVGKFVVGVTLASQ